MRLPLQLRSDPGLIDVVTLGESSLDFVARGGRARPGESKRRLDSFDLHVGGQTATAAVACARLGLSSRYIGAFGDDEWGARVQTHLGRAGVDVKAVVREGLASRVAVVLVDEAGERTVLEHREAGLEIDPADVDPAWIADARVLLVDATSPRAAIAAAEIARRRGVPTLVDVDRATPESTALLNAIDVIVVPEPFVSDWSGEPDLSTGLSQMAEAFPKASAVVATCGAAGSLALVQGVFIRSPGYRVDVVDTTGAGDAFRGGLAAAWVRATEETTFEDVLAAANATAALNCRAVGAQTSLPAYEDVQRLVTGATVARSN